MTNHDVQRIEHKLDVLLSTQQHELWVLYRLLFQGERIMAALDGLEAEVADVKTVQQSAIVLLNGLAQALKDAGTDPAKLAAIIADLDASKTALADAVVANTPAA